jgi:1,4-alpha-glucan branching enzyme
MTEISLASHHTSDLHDTIDMQIVQIDGETMIRVRAYLPHSEKAWLLHPTHTSEHRMRQVHPDGHYETLLPHSPHYLSQPCRLKAQLTEGNIVTMQNPYSVEPFFSEVDLHLFGEGNFNRAYEKMGAHIRTVNGTTGVNFAVWAPNAQGISVVGDFNRWDGAKHQMHRLENSGIWELFVPKLGTGEKYKFKIKTQWDEYLEKCDPYGFAAEVPPLTASVVADLNQFSWSDEEWLDRRTHTNPVEQPISIYEVHLGSWKRDGRKPNGWKNYRELAHELVEYCLEMNYTHLELMPVTEHPFTGSWGYQTVGYYAPTSRYGSPEDFMYFVNHCHQHGLGVILDWVPAHFPKDGHGLGRFDGSACYEHADSRQGEHPDWGTYIFNYGRNESRNYLLSNAFYWIDKFHIDGLRVDAVASMLYLDYSRENGEWIPNCFGGRENLEAIHFLKEFNERVHGEFPGVLTVAEESTAYPGVSRPTFVGGLGFSLKWNMGWMNDTLRYMRKDPIHRRYHHGELTFSLIYAFTENFMLPLSHDEVVHGKGALLDQMPGDLWQKFANLRLLYSFMWTHPGKKLLFQGCDIAQWNEFHHDAEPQWDLLQWESHRGMKNCIADLNEVYRREPALHQVDFEGSGFEWVDCHSNDVSVLAFLRKARNPADHLLICCNFTPTPRENYRVGVPHEAFYREIFNSDSSHYAGSNAGNFPGLQSEYIEAQGRPLSVNVAIPPLGLCIFKPE